MMFEREDRMKDISGFIKKSRLQKQISILEGARKLQRVNEERKKLIESTMQ